MTFHNFEPATFIDESTTKENPNWRDTRVEIPWEFGKLQIVFYDIWHETKQPNGMYGETVSTGQNLMLFIVESIPYNSENPDSKFSVNRIEHCNLTHHFAASPVSGTDALKFSEVPRACNKTRGYVDFYRLDPWMENPTDSARQKVREALAGVLERLNHCSESYMAMHTFHKVQSFRLLDELRAEANTTGDRLRELANGADGLSELLSNQIISSESDAERLAFFGKFRKLGKRLEKSTDEFRYDTECLNEAQQRDFGPLTFASPCAK